LCADPDLRRDPADARVVRGDAGALHPLTRVTAHIEDVFRAMGFMLLDYPEVESEFHNFDALNIPATHPARDMQDTFWVETTPDQAKQLLRTHTSTGQVRTMKNGEAAVPRHLPRPRLPLRRGRRLARAHLPPGRRA
jgi:phenylalanyl-tRNA synthetase alpha subunit